MISNTITKCRLCEATEFDIILELGDQPPANSLRKKITEPLIAKGEVTPEHLAQAQELGQTVACGLSMGIF